MGLVIGVCGFMALTMQGGWQAFTAVLSADRFFNLFARGFAVDMGAGLSLVLGVLTTQAYIQAITSAKSSRFARARVFTAAALIPPIGAADIMVGLYSAVMPQVSARRAQCRFSCLSINPPALAGSFSVSCLNFRHEQLSSWDP